MTINVERTIRAVLWLLLASIIICLFVPFSPAMPTFVDGERFATNQAVAQGLGFGKGFIYTYGPYVSILYKSYHPATDAMIMGGTFYLAVFYTLGLILLTRDVPVAWVAFLYVTFACVIRNNDSLVFSYPLIAGLAGYKIYASRSGNAGNIFTSSYWGPIAIAVLFAPLGLLPLIKGTMLILSAATIVLCAIYFIILRQKISAVVCVIAPLAVMLFFWTVAGQSVAGLSDYFTNITPIASGYSEAMALYGRDQEIIYYLVFTVLVIICVLTQFKMSWRDRALVAALFLVFLFISFKSGFVRHDGHNYIAAEATVLGALLLLSVRRDIAAAGIIIAAIFVLYTIDTNYTHKPSFAVYKPQRAIDTYTLAWTGLYRRVEDPAWPASDFDATVAQLKKDADFPVLAGSSDIYSYDQPYLIASGNHWVPRPVIQSYTAYTTVLANMNCDHLLGPDAPDNIIFKLQPLDSRYPSLEDGPSWPVLLRDYQPLYVKNDYLFLRHAPQNGDALVFLHSETHAMNETFAVPATDAPLFVQIAFKPTLIGRLAIILLKPSQLHITVTLRAGSKATYRLIANMTEAGFILSPLVGSTDQLHALYDAPHRLDDKQVTSVTIYPQDKQGIYWQNTYEIRFSAVNPTSR